jgi:flagellar protein FliS
MTAEKSYRQMSFQTASPVGMVIVLFDYAIDGVERAVVALDEGNIETRTNELGRALTALGELQGGLDLKQGGDVARRMERFYSLVRGQLLEGQIKGSREQLQKMLKLLILVRDAWKQGEQILLQPVLTEFSRPSLSVKLAPQLQENHRSVQWSA